MHLTAHLGKVFNNNKGKMYRLWSVITFLLILSYLINFKLFYYLIIIICFYCIHLRPERGRGGPDGSSQSKTDKQIVAAGSSGNWDRLAGMGRTDSGAWEAGAGEVGEAGTG